MLGPGGAKIYMASTLLIVSTSIIVTTLITIRLLHARRTLVKRLPSADVQVYTGVIAILIDSAAPLTIFGIILAVVTLEFGGRLADSSKLGACLNVFFSTHSA